MAAKVKERQKVSHEVLTIGQILIRKSDEHLTPMYRSMFFELNHICAGYGALIDLTSAGKVFVMGATGSCRKRIRQVYGFNVQKGRSGKVMELGGFR